MRELSAELALQPLRTALLAAAHRDADDVLATARSAADTAEARACAAAEEFVTSAERDGRVDAERMSTRDDARVRRQVRAIVLAAQRDVYVELRQRTRLATRALRGDPLYCVLRTQLETRARKLAGHDCAIAEVPDGGLVATGPGRVVRMTLDDLADWALDGLADAPAVAWSS